MKHNNFLTKEDREVLKRFAKETAFAAAHADDSDEELLAYLRDCAAALGHIPTKNEVIGCRYLKQRLGPWNRVLETAGLREVTPKRLAKLERDAARAAAIEINEEKETAV